MHEFWHTTRRANFYDPCLFRFINNPIRPVDAPVWRTADGAGALPRCAAIPSQHDNIVQSDEHIALYFKL
ncbi:unnamed protein product [Leptidea sinapis]|uniref:Uncharacterized protein n=1 Tax=Leptidea sinapis TaxID=189913 RepID=A0A5E4QR41_9NEOP|nr:unnamed protein product [Leptidea sinapis]